MMKLKLITTDERVLRWRSLERKKREVLKALNAGKGANFTTFDVVFDVTARTPELRTNKKGKPRVAHSWIDKMAKPWFNRGYDFVGIHFTKKHWLDAGLQESLRGSNPIDSDLIGEFVMWADEKTTRRYASGGSRLNQFIQVLLHEICHEYYRGAGLPDPTHEHHYTEGEIRDLVATLDWTLYRPELRTYRSKESLIRQLLLKIIELLTGKVEDLKQQVKYRRPTTLTPLVQRKADAIVAEMQRLGHPVRIVEGFRTFERQDKLYAQGRTTEGAIVTHARAGESYHNYGVAVDFVFRREGYNASSTLWQLLGAVGKRQGFEWGGDWQGFVDRPHFQLRLGYTLQDFKQGKVDYTKFN